MLPVISKDLGPITYNFWRPLFRQLDEMFDQQALSTRDLDAARSEYMPHYEIDETADHYVMSFDVPGVNKNDLSIEMTGNRLLISGERKSDERNGGRRYGKFQKIFTLPDGVTAEGIVAEHKDGVLRLAIEKPTSAKATKIKIADGASQNRDGGFFKSLVSSKKRDAINVKNGDPQVNSTAMAH